MLKRSILALAAAVALSACGGESVWAPDDVVARATYRHDGPPSLTVYTMVNNRSNEGAHSSVMINASQRVVFDPAGTLKTSFLPERNDVLYGMTPRMVDFYERAHARSTYHVIIQHVEVTPEVAERALQLAHKMGPAKNGQCALTTSGLISQLPGFEDVKQGWFPKALAAQMKDHPGVTTRILREDDEDDKGLAVAKMQAELSVQNQ